MKSKRSSHWIAGWVCLISVGAGVPSVVSADPNPYEEGVTRVELTPAERESLMLYANNSKALLDRAMTEARGKPLSEANDIYVTAIKRVVAESFKERRRSELLMRMALNQALELTVGTPTADGNGIQKEGVLARAQNLDLVTVILEDSIRLALSFYQDDRTAIDTGDLVRLPYARLAQKHLKLGKEWLSGVNEWERQLALSQALLEQWQSTLLQEDLLVRVRYAEVLLDVEDGLKKVRSGSYSVSQKARFLRAVVDRALESVQEFLDAGHARNLSRAAFMKIPRGTFRMGNLIYDKPEYKVNSHLAVDAPHQVTLTRDFEMQSTPVTQAQWVRVMGANPSFHQKEEHCPKDHERMLGVPVCPNHPVESVSWNDVKTFVQKLNSQVDDGYIYRLPTEAEWEYAMRAGTKTDYFFGDESLVEDYGWTYDGVTHPVALKKSNPWGLYDLYGNVAHWIMDEWASRYPDGDSVDPLYSVSDSSDEYTTRVLRGSAVSWKRSSRGGWFDFGESSYRQFKDAGFRLVRMRK